MTISRTGFLFRFAYWFTDPCYRPMQTNLCPFFWRCAAMLFIKMPLWWLVWAPIGTVLGFLFAGRPKFFQTDDYTPKFGTWPSPFACWAPYKGWWKFIESKNGWGMLGLPFFSLAILALVVTFTSSFEGLFLLCLLLSFAGALSITVLISKAIKVATPIVIKTTTTAIVNSETGRAATEWVAAKKGKYCPVIEVV